MFLKSWYKRSIGIVVLSILSSATVFANSKLSNGIVEYTPQKEKGFIYGSLNCRGSTNVGQYLKPWTESFTKLYPHIKSNLSFKGSSEGISALIDGSATIGASSRSIKESEKKLFEQLKGYPPLEFKIALDAIGIYVNRLNPIQSITLEELDAIFSSTKNREYSSAIDNWQPLTHRNKKINIYLLDSNSGTRSFFKKEVMLEGEYNLSNVVSEKFTLTSEIVTKVAEDMQGISFGSMGINNFRVKRVALAKRKNFPIYAPSEKNIKNGKYPLTRFFYIYLDVPPNKPVPALLSEFCKFILSREGQNIVKHKGGLPLSPKQIGIELSKLRRE